MKSHTPPVAANKTTLANRLMRLIETKVRVSKRFQQLEELTGIGARRWNSFSLGSQQPTVEMIEAVSKIWPQHAFWLMTGVEDVETGHIAPPAVVVDGTRVNNLFAEVVANGDARSGVAL